MRKPPAPEMPSCVSCTVRCNSLFNVIQENDLYELDKLKGADFYSKKELVFTEGKRPRGIFVLHSGKVKIFKTGDLGREQILRLAKPGDVIGYRSLISNDLYTASAATIEDSVVCFIPTTSLYALFEKHSSLALNFMRQLGHDLKEAEKRMVRMINNPVKERIAEMILLLRELYGTMEDGKTLNVVISREELANLAGTTTESAIRTLSELRDEGVIKLEKKRIVLPDSKQLLDVCGCED